MSKQESRALPGDRVFEGKEAAVNEVGHSQLLKRRAHRVPGKVTGPAGTFSRFFVGTSCQKQTNGTSPRERNNGEGELRQSDTLLIPAKLLNKANERVLLFTVRRSTAKGVAVKGEGTLMVGCNED